MPANPSEPSPAMRPRMSGSSESAQACERTLVASLQMRIPVSMCEQETGAGGTEFTTVPGLPTSIVIGRQIPAFTGMS